MPENEIFSKVGQKTIYHYKFMLPGRNSTLGTGKSGEDIAVNFLENEGYTILERNYHFERAEVDIVAYDNQRFIFVEVKTRTGSSFEESDERLSTDQFKRVMKAGEAWLYERKMEGAPVRFDLITIQLKGAEPVVIHYKNAGNDLQQYR